MNLCTSCGSDFSSVRAFDLHRVGVHDYLYSSERPNGRRCMSDAEMLSAGLAKNAAGRWADVANAESVRTRFARTATA